RGAAVETELILISEAVARLKAGMYGGLPEPKPVVSIKTNIKKGEVRPSIGWQPQNEDAAECFYEAIVQGKLSVFVRPVATGEKPHWMPFQVPLGALAQMITTRGGLPDHAVGATRIFANTSISPELLAALSRTALHVRRTEFEAW